MWSWTKAFHCDKYLVAKDDSLPLKKDDHQGRATVGLTQEIQSEETPFKCLNCCT